MAKCGIPFCKGIVTPPAPICEECENLGYRDDYELFLEYLDDGHSLYQAAVMAGLRDPDEASE